jgi:hypothetical protein
MPRHADATEVFIESLFRKYLETYVEKQMWGHTIKYSPAGMLDDASVAVRIFLSLSLYRATMVQKLARINFHQTCD